VVNNLNVIHIAGTKGKGSTCAYVESFLRAHGENHGFPRKTGLYTSPHLDCITERIRINSQPLSKELFAKYVFEVYEGISSHIEWHLHEPAIGHEPPRFLQLLALTAFHAFIREKVDVVICEAHHGGEFCATNFVRSPVVTAITTIGNDHLNDLGPSLKNVAWHKSGIFKSGAKAFSMPQSPELAAVLKSRAAEKGVALSFIEPDETPMDLFTSVQALNRRLALEVSNAFLERNDSKLSPEDILKGTNQFSWPGRFQSVLSGTYTWFLDGAHNELSIEVAASWFQVASERAQRWVPPGQMGMLSNILKSTYLCP
jgi:folylpolyglutamate synthase